jgi:hypothetical protein
MEVNKMAKKKKEKAAKVAAPGPSKTRLAEERKRDLADCHGDEERLDD